MPCQILILPMSEPDTHPPIHPSISKASRTEMKLDETDLRRRRRGRAESWDSDIASDLDLSGHVMSEEEEEEEEDVFEFSSRAKKVPVKKKKKTTKKNAEASSLRRRRRRGTANSSAKNYLVGVESNKFRSNVEFRERPRQGLFLACMVIPLGYIGWIRKDLSDEVDLRSDLFAAITAFSFCFLVYSAVSIRDGLMVRPHPMFWRITHGAGVLYVMVLAALLVQNVATARAFLRILYEDINERHDAAWDMQACEVNSKNIQRQLTSIWFLSHFLGWFGKMLMFRSWKLCMFLSVGFEIVEVSLQYIIPEFRECWWDSIFMDLLLANTGGMFFGWLVLKFLAFVTKTSADELEEEENGSSRSVCAINRPPPSPTSAREATGWRRIGNVLRMLVTRFLPYPERFEESYDWNPFTSVGRFLGNVIVVVVVLTVEANFFFLLYSLFIPPANPLASFRIVLLCFLALPAVAEWHDYMGTPVESPGRRFGGNTFLVLALVCLEVLISAKYSSRIFKVGAPPAGVLIPWTMTLLALTVWAGVYFGQGYHKTRRIGKFRAGRGFRDYRWMDWAFLLCFLPLLTLTRYWIWP